MRTLRAGLLAAGFLVVVLAPAAFAETISGNYEIRQDGKLIGAEKFDIDFASDGSFISKTSGTLKQGDSNEPAITDLTELRFSPAGTFLDYQREVYIGKLPRKLGAKYDGLNYLIQVSSPKGPMDHKVKAPFDALVADVGIYNHYTILVRQAVKKRQFGKPIPVVIPSEINQTTAVVEDRGDDAAKMEKGFFAARRYFIDMGLFGLNVWADASGRLIKIEAPMTGIVAEIRNYDGKRAESASTLKAAPRAIDRYEQVFASVGTMAGEKETKLRGVVRRPKRMPGRLPAVVFISDTGPQDADGKEKVTGLSTMTGDLCDAVAEAGFVVMSWDDRGVGGSGGDLAQATLDVISKDAQAALDILKTRDDVNPSRISVMGLGEGANVAMRVGAARKDVRSVAAIAPSPISFAALAEEQIRRRLKAENIVDDSELKNHPVVIALKKAREEKTDFTVIGGKPVYLDLYRQWDKLNPIADLKALKVPVLHITCEFDQQVFPDLNGPFIAAGKSISGYKHKEFDKLDHFLVRGRGTIGSYSDPDRKIDADAVVFIVRWLNAGN